MVTSIAQSRMEIGCVCVCVCVCDTTAQIRMMFGMETSMKDLISVRRLCWLGHTLRMSGDRIPKKLLLGWLSQTQPAHGAKLRWRNKARQDLKRFTIPESNWYHLCENRIVWRDVRQDGLQRVQNAGSHTAQFVCETCHQEFRRSQDIARHKCQTTRPQRKKC